MATRTSLLRYLTAGLVAGFALSLAPTAPVHADEYPTVRTKRMRTTAPRVRTVYRTVPQVRTVVQVRTVERVRTRMVCYDYDGQPFDCRSPAPVAYYTAPTTCGGCTQTYVAPVQYYYPVQRYHGTGCGTCGQTAYYNGGYGGYDEYSGYNGGHYGVAPYYRGAYRWAVRGARYNYRHAQRHAWQYRRGRY